MGWSHSRASLRCSLSILLWLSQGLHGAVPDLDKAHPLFDEPPSDQRLAAVQRVPIHLPDAGRLSADVEGIDRFQLHPRGQFERLDARLDRRDRPSLQPDGGGSAPPRARAGAPGPLPTRNRA